MAEKRPLLRDTLDDADQLAFSHHVPLSKKLAFACGAPPSQLCNTVVGFFLAAYLLEVAGLRPVYVSVVLFGGRFWDAVTDPVVGYLTTRTQTRLGRLRPWVGGSIIPFAAAYVCLWVIPEGSDGGRVVYTLIIYLLFQTFNSTYHVPYTALTVHMSETTQGRDSATAYRMGFEVVSVLFAAGFQGVMVDTIGGAPTASCRNCTATGDTTHNSAQRQAYLFCALVFAGIMITGGLITFFFIKERPRLEGDITHQVTFAQGFKMVVRNKTYRVLLGMFLFVWMIMAVSQTNTLLYIKYTLEMEHLFTNFLIVLLVFTFLGLPLTAWSMKRFGKRNTYIIGLAMSLPTSLGYAFIDKDVDVWVVYELIALGGLGLSPMYLVPWAMLPDVIDEAHYNTGQRYEAIYYSYFVFFQKFATGIALGISSVVLELAGYITNPCCGQRQPKSLSRTLTIMMGPVPIGFVVIGMIISFYYPLSQAKVREIKGQLLSRLSRAATPVSQNGNGKTEYHAMGGDDELQQEYDPPASNQEEEQMF